MSQLPTPQNATALRQARKKSLAILRDTIIAHFSEPEVRTLCDDIGVEYDDLPAQGRKFKVGELVLLVDRQNRISELVAKCRELRPNVEWIDIPELASGPVDITPDEAERARRHSAIVEVCVERVGRLLNTVWRRRKVVVRLLLATLVVVILVILFRRFATFRFDGNFTSTPTRTPTLTSSATATPTPTLTSTLTPSPTLTIIHTPSHTRTAAASPTATLAPTQEPTAAATITPRPFPTITRIPLTLTPTQPLAPTEEEKEPPRPPRPP